MLYFIPTPIGNLSDISFHALNILKTCDKIICEDTRVAKSLINLLNKKFNTNIKPNLFLSLNTHNEKQFLSKLNNDFFDTNIAFLSDAGMPCISDPGSFLIKYAQNNNINYEVLPGANAALCALVASGFSEKEFIFLGFLSNKGKERAKDIEKLLKNPYTSIVYESPKRILTLIETIASIDENREIFLIKEISKKFEKKFKNQAQILAKELKNENLNGEWVVVLKGINDKWAYNTLCEKDILDLDISLKTKSKLLSKLNGKNNKIIYNELLQGKLK